MRMSYHLKLEQTQKLVMTPELQQAITLLQYSALELQTYVQNQLLENPVLEIDESEDTEKKTDESVEEPVQEKDSIDWEEYLKDEGMEPMTSFTIRQNEDAPGFDYYLSNEPTLQEHLLFQLGLCSLTPTEKHIGEFIIGNLDQHGYLKGDFKELAMLIGAEPREILGVLEVIQKFDPVGVGARDLQECLLLQIQEHNSPHPLAKPIVRTHLADVADNKIKKIASELRAGATDVQAAVDFIRTLDPKPGRLAGDVGDVRYVVPDVVVEKVDGEYVVIVNEQNIPRLAVNPYYRSLLGKDSESVTSTFIKTRLDSALWLLKSIEQRRITVYRVTECITRIQRDFFDQGIKHLRPMTLRQIADEIGVHESTVSRATSNKFVQTPRGLFPLKFFFASGVDDYHGTAVSSESIKCHLKELIEAENVQRPLSDQKLMELLSKRGIVVSRRTVAKYREEMSIPSSNKRKRL
ncbi:RNA polymerase factor sigma-54 [Dethiobacter alkaliphilus]|uniref:RNA polymerase, sigma 54 subunit, RpoN n=1 Tax=Dethiobacter alkaliphilus AHT 1 TaxID=555088 RepID=C0GFB1_DETAL|nr:RNA polymerase factor sigma-54 [Dethiobacter alkaliphilus]EEG77871.1 RNA polymerase, sigma 54 subunit, RpoN [Dethiobacter alkaliphilus AHT 1]